MSTTSRGTAFGRDFKALSTSIILLLIAINCAKAAVDYAALRKDTIPQEITRESARTTRNILVEVMNRNISTENNLQRGTEQLLQYGALLRTQILDTFGKLVYDRYDDFSMSQIEALYRIYRETLERKYNIFDIVPSVLDDPDTRPTKICAHINAHISTCLKESSMTCMNVKIHDEPHEDTLSKPALNATRQIYELTKIATSYPRGFSPAAVLDHLKSGKLRFTPTLFSGLLHNAQYDSFDDKVRTAERELVLFLTKAPRNFTEDTKRAATSARTVSELLRNYLTMGKNIFTGKALRHADYLAEHVIREVDAISENIELLGTVYDNSTINLKYLFQLILPNDTMDRDVLDARDYLLRQIRDMKIVENYLRVEKYQQAGPDQLLMEIFGQLRDIHFAEDLVTSLYTHARFWHKSHMIKSLDELLELFDAYENLRGVPEYRSFLKAADRIKRNLEGSRNVTVELLCSRPRPCLRIGLEMVRNCAVVNAETKRLIDTFTDRGCQCSCLENDSNVRNGSTNEFTTEEIPSKILTATIDSTTESLGDPTTPSTPIFEGNSSDYENDYSGKNEITKSKVKASGDDSSEETPTVATILDGYGVIKEETVAKPCEGNCSLSVECTGDDCQSRGNCSDAGRCPGESPGNDCRGSDCENHGTTMTKVTSIHCEGSDCQKTYCEGDDCSESSCEDGNCSESSCEDGNCSEDSDSEDVCSSSDCNSSSCEGGDCQDSSGVASSVCEGGDCQDDSTENPAGSSVNVTELECNNRRCPGNQQSIETDSIENIECQGPDCSINTTCQGSDCFNINCTGTACSRNESTVECEDHDCLKINCTGSNCTGNGTSIDCKGSNCSSRTSNETCSGSNCSLLPLSLTEGKSGSKENSEDDCEGTDCSVTEESDCDDGDCSDVGSMTESNCEGTSCRSNSTRNDSTGKGIEDDCEGLDCKGNVTKTCNGDNCSVKFSDEAAEESAKELCNGENCTASVVSPNEKVQQTGASTAPSVPSTSIVSPTVPPQRATTFCGNRDPHYRRQLNRLRKMRRLDAESSTLRSSHEKWSAIFASGIQGKGKIEEDLNENSNAENREKRPVLQFVKNVNSTVRRNETNNGQVYGEESRLRANDDEAMKVHEVEESSKNLGSIDRTQTEKKRAKTKDLALDEIGDVSSDQESSGELKIKSKEVQKGLKKIEGGSDEKASLKTTLDRDGDEEEIDKGMKIKTKKVEKELKKHRRTNALKKMLKTTIDEREGDKEVEEEMKRRSKNVGKRLKKIHRKSGGKKKVKAMSDQGNGNEEEINMQKELNQNTRRSAGTVRVEKANDEGDENEEEMEEGVKRKSKKLQMGWKVIERETSKDKVDEDEEEIEKNASTNSKEFEKGWKIVGRGSAGVASVEAAEDKGDDYEEETKTTSMKMPKELNENNRRSAGKARVETTYDEGDENEEEMEEAMKKKWKKLQEGWKIIERATSKDKVDGDEEEIENNVKTKWHTLRDGWKEIKREKTRKENTKTGISKEDEDLSDEDTSPEGTVSNLGIVKVRSKRIRGSWSGPTERLENGKSRTKRRSGGDDSRGKRNSRTEVVRTHRAEPTILRASSNRKVSRRAIKLRKGGNTELIPLVNRRYLFKAPPRAMKKPPRDRNKKHPWDKGGNNNLGENPYDMHVYKRMS